MEPQERNIYPAQVHLNMLILAGKENWLDAFHNILYYKVNHG